MSNLPENVKRSMRNSKISQKVDLCKLDRKSMRDLKKACKQRDFTNRLKKFEEFFSSSTWATMHNQPNAHDFAFEISKETFGNGNSSIIDNGEAKYGQDFWNKLSTEQKNFVIDVDTNKKTGLYKYQGLYVRYIGTSIVGAPGMPSTPPWVSTPPLVSTHPGPSGGEFSNNWIWENNGNWYVENNNKYYEWINGGWVYQKNHWTKL